MKYQALDFVQVRTVEGPIVWGDTAIIVSVDPGAPEKQYLCVDEDGRHAWYREKDLKAAYPKNVNNFSK